MDTPAPRLRLRLLVCNPKSYGSRNITCKGSITGGTTPRTKEDPYLPSVFSYECKTEAEWQRLTTGISKQLSNQNAFHAYAHFVDPLLPPGPAGRVLCEAFGEYAPPVPVEVAVAPTEEGTDTIQIISESSVVATPPVGFRSGEIFRIATEPESETVAIVSTSQEGSEPVEVHNLDEVGVTPTPATIPAPPAISAPEEQPETAQEPIAEPEPETAPVEPEAKPLYSAAWDKLESPMRLKDLAAALEVDAETLKGHLANPNSAVELGHAGWVKRREPKA